MATKRKVSVSTGPTAYRLSSADRHAAQVKKIANQQGELKREAAERRAKRATEASEGETSTAAAVPPESPSSERSNGG